MSGLERANRSVATLTIELNRLKTELTAAEKKAELFTVSEGAALAAMRGWQQHQDEIIASLQNEIDLIITALEKMQQEIERVANFTSVLPNT